MDFGSHFGRLLEAFWEANCDQKWSEILDAILEAKKVAFPLVLGRPGGMRRASGEIIEGYENIQKRRGERGQGQGYLEACLARRPGWGGGSLRALRRAEVIDVVSFDRCVGWSFGSP